MEQGAGWVGSGPESMRLRLKWGRSTALYDVLLGVTTVRSVLLTSITRMATIF